MSAFSEPELRVFVSDVFGPQQCARIPTSGTLEHIINETYMLALAHI